MKHLILTFEELNSIKDSESFKIENLEKIMKREELNDIEKTLKGINEKDLLPYRISSYLTKNQHASIIIFKKGIDWARIIRIAAYLRLIPYENWVSKAPIIICADNLPDPFLDKELENINDIQNYFNIQGVFYKSFDDLFLKKENDEGRIDYKINIFINTIKKNFDTRPITVISENLVNDRHSITNYWGAVKLAMNAGFSKDEINYNFPPTLYFNYLLKNHGLKNISTEPKANFGEQLEKQKILLIDDNSDKGWKKVLEKIFGDNTIDSKSFMLMLAKKNNKDLWELRKGNKLNEYDLVFLDLYLPEKRSENPDLENGKKLLSLIKEKHPEIPIIIFTASNKSWNQVSVIENGADGMYVKESPEYAGDEKYSKENFKNFVKIVNSTLEKYRVLRPFYEAIQKILNNQKFKKMELKERIRERLMMFYGLLKRGFEQTEFNKKLFHFSDYELAYMTLWSVLNEISEAYYEKSRPDIDVFNEKGEKFTHHPNGKSISYLPGQFKWNIRGQSDDTFIEYKYSLINDSTVNKKGFYILKPDQISPFSYQNNDFLIGPVQSTRIKLENTIFMQIAFLLEKLVSLPSSNKTKYQKDLVDLNKIRNQLYLTHGDDNNSNYYAKTESEKRKAEEYNITPSGDIKRLFELIRFLLTGEDIKIQV